MKRIDKKLALPLKRARPCRREPGDTAETVSPRALVIVGCACCPTLYRLDGEQTLLLQNYGGLLADQAATVDYAVRGGEASVLLILGHSGCAAVKSSLTPSAASPSYLDVPRKALAGCFEEGRGRSLKDNVLRRVDYEVALALARYGDLVKAGRLSVVGGLYDDAGDGRLYFTNYNGLKERIADHFNGLLPDEDASAFCL